MKDQIDLAHFHQLISDCLQVYEAARGARKLPVNADVILEQADELMRTVIPVNLLTDESLCLAQLPADNQDVSSARTALVRSLTGLAQLRTDDQTISIERLTALSRDVESKFEDLKADAYELGKSLLVSGQGYEIGATAISGLAKVAPAFRDVKLLQRFAGHFCQARVAFDRQEWDAAKKGFAEALKSIPSQDVSLRRECHLRVARAAAELAQWTIVRDHLATWLKIAPDDAEARALYRESHLRPAQVASQAGDWSAARSHLELWTKFDASDAEARSLHRKSFLVPAQAAMQVKQWEDARLSLRAWLKIKPADAEAHTLYRNSYLHPAQAAIQDQEWDAARSHLAAWLKIDAAGDTEAQALFRESHLRPAQVALQAQQWESVRSHLVAWLKIDAGDAEAQTLLRESHLRPAQVALQAEQWEGARTILKAWLKIEPADAEARTLHRDSYLRPAQAALKTERWDAAQDFLRAWQKIEGQDAEAHTLYRDSFIHQAQRAFQAGQWASARTSLAAWLKIEADDAEARRLYCEAYLRPARLAMGSQLWEEARHQLEDWIKLAPSDAEAKQMLCEADYQIGEQALRQGQFALAAISFGRLNTIDASYRSGSVAAVRTFLQHNSDVLRIAWNLNGQLLASADWGEVKIWDTASGRMLQVLKLKHAPDALVWSPNGNFLAISDMDKAIVWDTANACQHWVVQMDKGDYCRTLIWSPDGQLLAITSFHAVRIWDVGAKELVHCVREQRSGGLCKWSPDSQCLALAEQKTIRIWWDTRHGQLPNDRRVLTSLFSARWQFQDALTRDGFTIADISWYSSSYLLAVGTRGEIKGWDTKSKVWHTLREIEGRGWGLPRLTVFSPTSTLQYAIVGVDITIGDSKLPTPVHAPIRASHSINNIAWSADGQFLASAGQDMTVEIWDARRGTSLYTLSGHSAPVASVVWSQDNRHLLSASNDKAMKVWDAQRGQLLHSLAGFTEGLAWHPKETWLAAADGKTVKVWGYPV